MSPKLTPEWRPRLLPAGLVLVIGALGLSACTEVESADVSGYEPSKLEEVKGTDAKRVTFTAEGARRTGLQTAALRDSGKRTVAPYAALIYDGEGKTFVYTSPQPLSFMRAAVKVDRIDADRVLMSAGPPAGTQVVTVGAAEVYGTELEIGGGH
ncbi:MAG TPA: hypothetical protein VES79_13980 [Solirubrobacteraceae bacterium]|nr:hypothetical protein [Solirubrobacteraceae bacterium]